MHNSRNSASAFASPSDFRKKQMPGAISSGHFCLLEEAPWGRRRGEAKLVSAALESVHPGRSVFERSSRDTVRHSAPESVRARVAAAAWDKCASDTDSSAASRSVSGRTQCDDDDGACGHVPRGRGDIPDVSSPAPEADCHHAIRSCGHCPSPQDDRCAGRDLPTMRGDICHPGHDVVRAPRANRGDLDRVRGLSPLPARPSKAPSRRSTDKSKYA